jgi:protein involved in polysaccharide export with SLBB domain
LVDQFGDPLPQSSVPSTNNTRMPDTNNTQSAETTAGSQRAAQDVGQNALQTNSANANSPYNSYAPNEQAREPALNFQEQSVRSDQFASNREVTRFGDLARQLGVDPLVLINFLIDYQAKLEGAVHGPGFYFVGPNVPLSDLVQAAGGTANWADESGVELLSTAVSAPDGRAMSQHLNLPLRQGTLATYVVRPRDQLHFNQVFNDVGGTATLQGEVRFPGTYPILRGEHLSDLLVRAGGVTNIAYPYGTVFLRKSAAQTEKEGYMRVANEVENQLLSGMTRSGSGAISPATFTSMQDFVEQLRNQKAVGRVSVIADPSILASKPELDPILESGDILYIPQRPSTVAVLGEVMHQGSFAYQSGKTVNDYIQLAGGYSKYSYDSYTFIVLPDGTAQKVEMSWLNFASTSLPPGSTIVVPRDISPFDWRQSIIDTTQLFSQLAVTAASLAVLSKQ